MDIRTQSALLASIVGLALGLSMLLRAERSRVVTLFSLFAFTVGGFYFAHFLVDVISPEAFPGFARVVRGSAIVLASLIPSTALGFFLEFLEVSPKSARKGRNVALFSGVFGVAVGVTPLSGQFWPRVALSAWVFGALFVSVSLLLRRMRQSDSRIERARMRYLAWGGAACLLFAAWDLLPRFGVPVPTLGPVVSTLYLFFLAQTLLRLRLMDLHELLGKVASQTVLASILAVVVLILTAWVHGNPSLFVFNTILAAFVISILLEPLRAKVEERVVAVFFRERFELIRSLSQLRARIANVIDVDELATLVLDGLNETGRITHASVYLLAEDRPGFRLLASRGPQPAFFLDAAGARGLLHVASTGQKAVLREHLDRRTTDLRGSAIEGRKLREELKRIADTRAALVAMKSGACVPLFGNDRVIGFLNLWDERVPEAYASDEIALVLDIGERMATVIENSKLYDKMRERDRLAALGEMAAGLAHEIRNPLGAIKGAVQVLDPRKVSGEEAEFFGVIVEEVNRLNGVVSAFLDYSRPLKQSFGPTDVNEAVIRTVRLIHQEIPSGIELKLELSDGLSRIDGDAEQLKQVLINLIQNAVQAMADRKPGRITIRTAKPERFGDFRGAGEMVELHVSDNGPGIPPDQQLHIFVPFFTTKEKGTGLGLAICQRIVKNHGGTISVQSRVGEGSDFIIRLPALAAQDPVALPETGTPAPGALARPAVPAPAQPPPANPSRRERRRRRAG